MTRHANSSSRMRSASEPRSSTARAFGQKTGAGSQRRSSTPSGRTRRCFFVAVIAWPVDTDGASLLPGHRPRGAVAWGAPDVTRKPDVQVLHRAEVAGLPIEAQ